MYSLRSSGEKSSTQLPGEGTAIEATIYSIWVGIKRGTLLATGLRAYAADPDLQQEWMMVKKVNKMRLAEYIEAMSGVKASFDAMFDVQTKRIHKYKEQLLNILALSIDMTVSRTTLCLLKRAITILLHCAYLVHLLVTHQTLK
ncbi:unnamed protein product [Prunus armeniaca]